MTIQELEERNLIIYKHVRGSTAQGCAIEGVSDVDFGGIYILPEEYMYGLNCEYIPQVSNETNDETYYELGRFMELVLKNNPTIIESLFVDDEFIIKKHPAIDLIKELKNEYLNKRLIHNTVAFATSQIRKCSSSEKLFSHPVTEKRGPLDFCYTFYNQGSTKLVDWLDNHGLNQRYCGLVSVPNMHNMYGVYYDWRAHLEDMNWKVKDVLIAYAESTSWRRETDEIKISKMRLGQTLWEIFPQKNNIISLLDYDSDLDKLFCPNRLGYSGIVAEDGSSNTLRYIQDNYSEKDGVMLNSVAKGQEPICYMSFNADGYAKHLRDYARYQKWLKERNPVRYENNKGYRYDAKNVMHCFRLLNMAIEMARDGEIHTNRSNIDRDFLLSIRNHAYSYEELMEMLNKKELEVKQALDNCELPDDMDLDKVNNLLIKIRKEFYNNLEG